MGMKVTNTVNNFSLSYGMNRQKAQGSVIKKTAKKNGNIKVNIGFNAAGTMAKLAATKTKTQAAALERSLRELLKSAIRFESDEMTIREIKRVIGKAGFKVKALGKEERMRNLKKVAEGADNTKEEQRIEGELRRKKRARKSKERAEIADVRSVLGRKNYRSNQEWLEEDEYQDEWYDRDMGIDVLCDGIDTSAEMQAVTGTDGSSVDISL